MEMPAREPPPLYGTSHFRVLIGNVSRELAAAGRRSQALDVEQILHRHAQAVQRTQRFAAGKLGVGQVSLGAGRAPVAADDGIDRRIQRLDALDGGLECGSCRDLGVLDGVRKLGRAEPSQIRVHVLVLMQFTG